MKHLKGVNRKAKEIEKDREDVPVVEAQGIIPFMHTCTSVFNPGYENDWTGSTKQLCTPIETDLPFAGRRRIDLPAEGNLPSADGTRTTGVVVQHPEDGIEDGHEVVFQTESPKRQYRSFLEGFARGRPIVPE